MEGKNLLKSFLMDINQFIEKFKNQFMDSDDLVIYPETEFRQIPSWDSLTGMSIIVMIYDEYEVEMKDIDLRACKKVEDIFNFIVIQK